MQDPNAGVPLYNHTCKPENKTYKLCFTGKYSDEEPQGSSLHDFYKRPAPL